MKNAGALPDWPKLMSLNMAASYFSVSVNTFRSLGIVPIEIGRRVLFDRASLDSYAARRAGQPLDAADRKSAMDDVERRFLERRGRG